MQYVIMEGITYNYKNHYAIFCIPRNEICLAIEDVCIEKRSFCENNIFAFNKWLTNESWDFVYESKCRGLLLLGSRE